MRVHHHATWCVGVLSLVLPTPSQTAVRAEDEKKGAPPGVEVTYTSPTVDVHLKGTKIAYQVREEEYDNPVSSTPSKVVTVTRKTVVRPAAVKELLAAIKSAGFYELKDEYGVKAGQRHYPYEVRVKDRATEKKVIYRSGGDDRQRPKVFAKVEKLLTDFAKRETTLKKR
jgi:ABC-type nitrate/sulfonate/bicarbonate transport system substrate-binding protein